MVRPEENVTTNALPYKNKWTDFSLTSGSDSISPLKDAVLLLNGNGECHPTSHVPSTS